ncbi:metal-dependent phosphohydrolase [Streptomyces sp. NPDC048269]|uniref:metal-dependent phosphohydrolase n=1 Tax=Streptomyces sp. NPDC048269 TaxID=3155753 RepID=UPI00343896E5
MRGFEVPYISSVPELIDLLHACREGRGMRTAALLRRARPFDKELQIAGLVQDLGELLRTGDGAFPADHAEAVRPLLGERVARLVRLHARAANEAGLRALAGAGPDGEAAAALCQAHDTADAAALDAGVLEDWRPVLELVAAGAYRVAGPAAGPASRRAVGSAENAIGPLGTPRGPRGPRGSAVGRP